MSFDARQAAVDLLDELCDEGAIELAPNANRTAVAADLAELIAVPLELSATIDWIEGWLFSSDDVSEVFANRSTLEAIFERVRGR